MSVVAAGEGKVRRIGGERLTFKARGAGTARAVALLEDTAPPGYAPPPHIHTDENEIFSVLGGSSLSRWTARPSPRRRERP